ncbi:hypothetical protein LJC30_00920 [Odoribacter sp. OttesenSCG-928-L07]|nr:hypothetical protein [Odoribacter sp. OttesenSCG-928-L07]MDL2238979.1 hypothetical protein [Bacteroidales bacterium OttesenSCG-928-L14]MDL2240868.1 hypothetical protein [Bacteroidales bacterium OttesenSCG-928-K22]
MYTLKKLLLFTLLIQIIIPLAAQKTTYHPYKERDKMEYNGYQYPLFPGTEEWKALPIDIDRYALLQLPEDTLYAISTYRLLETCLYYPMMIDIFGFDNQIIAFGLLRNYFNGLNELFCREDIVYCLLSYYFNRIPDRITTLNNSYDRGKYSLDFIILEIMIYQPEIVSQLNNSQTTLLIKDVLQKLNHYSSLKQYFGQMSISIPINVLGQILIKNGTLTNASIRTDLTEFLKTGYLRYPEDYEFVLKHAQNIL